MGYRNYSLDVLKFILAYEVVMLHCSQEPVGIVRPIVDSAVPCFFMVSGYLIYTEDIEKYKGKLLRAIKRICYILLWSSFLCGLNDLYRLLFCQEVGNFTLKAFFYFIVFNENPFAFHLWYISAYLYTLLFFIILLKNKIQVQVWWVFGLWAFGIVVVIAYYHIFHNDINFIYIRNFLFQGIPCFGFGLFVKKNEAHIKIIKKRHFFFFLIVIVVMAILIKGVESYSIETYIFSELIALFTLLLFTKIQINTENFISVLGKEDGLYIYVFHPLIMNFLKTDYILSSFGYNAYLHSTIVFLLTIVSIRIFQLSKRLYICP